MNDLTLVKNVLNTLIRADMKYATISANTDLGDLLIKLANQGYNIDIVIDSKPPFDKPKGQIRVILE